MWKIIPRTNNLYECNQKGEVRRVVSLVSNQPKTKADGFRKVGGKILSPKTKNNGYKELNLTINTQTNKSFYVHRLVVETWIGEIPSKMTINHIDGDKSNNNLSNLEIVSYSDNMKHAYKLGLNKIKPKKGEDHALSKTNEKEVLKIRKEHKKHRSIKQLLQDYPHLAKGTLTKIVYRQSWKHI